MENIKPAETNAASGAHSSKRRRNIILGVILACASLFMYISIFIRLSENPLQ
jgi:hypothetical protein